MLSELIDSLEVKFFKLNQKVAQLEKKNQELQAELLLSKKNRMKWKCICILPNYLLKKGI